MSPSDRRWNDLRAYEALMAADADEAAENATETAAGITPEADAALATMIDEKLAAIGARQLAAARAARLAEKPVAVRPGLRAMVGAELRAHLRKLEAAFYGGQLVAAHRNLDEVSDDDLRSMIADLEAIAPGAAPDDE